MHIRQADPASDAAGCAAVYAPYVRDTAVSFEEDAPSGAEMRRRMGTSGARYPWLVAEDGGTVVGYAYASQHRGRAAYRWAVDVAIYLDAGHHRRGIGRALYQALFERLTRQGFRMACAGITLPNAASVALHEKVGFEFVGTYRQIGWKSGRWHDVAWYQRPLGGPPSQDPPQEPGPAHTWRATCRRVEVEFVEVQNVSRRGPPAELSALFWFLLDHQGQRGAGVHRSLGQAHQLGGNVLCVDEGIAPVVQPDQLGEELDAQGMRLAGDRIDPQADAHGGDPGAGQARRTLIAGPRPPDAPCPRPRGTRPARLGSDVRGARQSPDGIR
jgi:L-amino acid N-acyltransferase YncA